MRITAVATGLDGPWGLGFLPGGATPLTKPGLGSTVDLYHRERFPMRRCFALLAALFVAAVPSMAAAELYAAISYSPSTVMAGTAWYFATGVRADSAA